MTETKFDYSTIAQQVKAAVRAKFPEDTIVVSEGYNGRVHLKLVSQMFDGWNEREKQAYIWDLLRDELPEVAQGVSLALAYGTDEL